MTEKTRKGEAVQKDKPQTVFEFSAGGVVLQAGAVLLIWTKDLKGNSVVTLPKGLVRRAEKSEQAALREVREETGYRCRITSELPRAEYFYRRGGLLVRKTVRWFLMEPLAQEGVHDHEVDEVHWVPLAAAREELSYSSDRKLIESVIDGEGFSP